MPHFRDTGSFYVVTTRQPCRDRYRYLTSEEVDLLSKEFEDCKAWTVTVDGDVEYNSDSTLNLEETFAELKKIVLRLSQPSWEYLISGEVALIGETGSIDGERFEICHYQPLIRYDVLTDEKKETFKPWEETA